MSEFEKWFKNEEGKCFEKRFYQKPSIMEAYQAGAQSKQAEIDELRKRIDEAIDYLHDGNQRELSYEYADAINDVIDILKGTTNEQ